MRISKGVKWGIFARSDAHDDNIVFSRRACFFGVDAEKIARFPFRNKRAFSTKILLGKRRVPNVRILGVFATTTKMIKSLPQGKIEKNRSKPQKKLAIAVAVW